MLNSLSTHIEKEQRRERGWNPIFDCNQWPVARAFPISPLSFTQLVREMPDQRPTLLTPSAICVLSRRASPQWALFMSLGFPSIENDAREPVLSRQSRRRQHRAFFRDKLHVVGNVTNHALDQSLDGQRPFFGMQACPLKCWSIERA